ncbi:phosphate/phosphite/phosphonate ABC transporter substrate-binding protein [Amphritea atlantica]|uniref:phosphate/phosphite/phosphonate ABC transporter substrate-binding protein n=1 Tax=Amphritea atlantica TaxID=355243 RepID=UPI001C31DCF6
MIYALTLLLSLSLSAPDADADTLTFGVVPQQSAKRLAQLWTPIFNYLSEKTGETIRFSTAHDIPTFEKRLLAGEYDIAYMNPYHYTVFHQVPGYQALAKQKDKRIQGIVVVRKDSPLTELAELNGQTLAFPSPAAFAASIVPRAQMGLEGIHITPKYVSSHDSVYLGVSRGFFVAGGGVMRTFNNIAPEVKAQLRVLWRTPTYTPHAIAVHPRINAETVAKLRNALLAMNDDPEGRALLKAINFQGIETAQDSDWDDVRALKIKLLDDLLQ